MPNGDMQMTPDADIIRLRDFKISVCGCEQVLRLGIKMTQVRKGYCSGCPFDYGMEATEMAYNLGCLPSIGEVDALCLSNQTAWACHSEPNKVCCGHAARRNLPLQHLEGVHTGASQ